MRSLRSVAPLAGPIGAAVALLIGCAGSGANLRPGDATANDGAARVWQALADGHDDQARALLDNGRGGQGSAAWWLADGALAFERGDVLRAVAAYLATLETAGADESALAAMAAGRLGTLLDEHPGPDAERRAAEERILRISPARWSWEARFALGSLWDRIARLRGDPALLAQVGARAGCIDTLTVTAPVGRLPHLDLDSVPASDGSGRTVHVTGCRAAVPSYDGRAGAQRVLIDVAAPAPGPVDIVVAFRGEGRVIVDGAPAHRHGDERLYGPLVSATRATWGPGRHRLELRLATYGGRPELTVMVFPAADSNLARTASVPEAAAMMAEAYVANQVGDVARTQIAGVRLGAPSFALGAALGAALVRDDPSLPSAFGRDRARTLLRRAVGTDPGLARARNTLAGMALDDDRPREAIEEARLAVTAAPAWWLPRLSLHAAYQVRGLEWDADRALDEALVRGPRACAVVEAALSRAETRRDIKAVRRFTDDEAVCGATGDDRIDRLRRRGDWAEAERLLRLGLVVEPDPESTRSDLARLLLARGRAAEAVALLEPHLERTDGDATVAWADAAIAAGQRERARARVAGLLDDRPDLPQLVRAARVLDLPLPIDPYRLDGRAVIRAFEASQRHYAAPAVVVLDRSVTRVFPSGAAMTLTHEIVRVQSKDAIEKWGEVSLPEGAEVLTLRTHKPDGTTREPEEVAGKEAISAADLAIGDYLEKETLELSAPHQAFAPARAGGPAGYLGDRFYFQSFDAPLDRSEYLLVTSPAMADALAIDSRAGAPAALRAPASGGAVVTTFAARQVPQLFGERAAVPAIEHVPSVRVSVDATWSRWARFLREQMCGTARDGAALDRAVAEIQGQAAGVTPDALAAAVAAWVGQNVESDDDLRGAATIAVASGRGNRVAAIQALAHRLGLTAHLVLGRSRFTAEGPAPTPIQEADDFAEVLLRFDLPGGRSTYVDPRLKHAPFGYLSPGMTEGRVLDLETAAFQTARTTTGDARAVDMTVRLDADGQATGQVVETVRGWPALEWAEIVDRFGADETKLRQDFEQRWLGVHFPGAALKDLRVEILGSDGRQREEQPVRVTAPGALTTTPLTADTVRVRYTFVSRRFAVPSADRLRVQPTFFRAQPGRRYATEPRRSIGVMTGFEIPTTVTARIVLPPFARLDMPAAERVIERPGQYRFLEGRRLDTRDGTGGTLELRREARLGIQRIAPAAYPAVAADLRAADAMEGEEIVLRLPPRTSEHRP